MKKRTEKDIWQGLFDFALIEKDTPVKAESLLKEKQYQSLLKNIATITISRKYEHVLTHQKIDCRFIHLKAKRSFSAPDNDLSFYSAIEIAHLPKPVLISRYLSDQKTV